MARDVGSHRVRLLSIFVGPRTTAITVCLVLGIFAAAAATAGLFAEPPPSVVGVTVLVSPRTKTSGCALSPNPDRRCSPGAYYSKLTKQVLCSSSSRSGSIGYVAQAEKVAVEAEYGMKPAYYGRTLEIDHIIGVEIGGSNNIANLFPERATPSPGYPVKDKLENKLHALVCSGEMTLRAAQRGIATNWQALYKRVFGNAPTAPPKATPGLDYPLHTGIVATTFWVGEIFNANIADGSQVCSAYDSKWAFHWSGGVNVGTDPSTDCKGAPIGGCDGRPSGTGPSFKCATEARAASNGYFPTSPLVHPTENPFYLDLPFDDVNDSTALKERCQVIPWAAGAPASQCSDQSYSFMKNHWVAITGPNGHTCYGQVEDAGPSHGNLYHDANYVFGTSNAQPIQGQFNNAGMDVSPALNGCLGFAELDGDNDHVSWRFVDSPPAGPWTKIVTTRQVS
jgi:hypothetical protein